MKGSTLGLGKKAAFLLGNVAPDINPFSYLSPGSDRHLGGHFYEYRKTHIERFLGGSGPCRKTWMDWYRIGVNFHYLADSFTRPHNGSFPCRLKEHFAYERSLHQRFCEELKRGRQMKLEAGELLDPSWFEKNHSRYLKESRGLEEDCQYILQMTWVLCQGMVKEQK